MYKKSMTITFNSKNCDPTMRAIELLTNPAVKEFIGMKENDGSTHTISVEFDSTTHATVKVK